MDDFNVSSLHESRNEWSARLVTILTPLIIDGYKSILEEAIKLCRENGEMDKYLMTFQNFISRIPKWNATIIETEKKRIIEKSGCSYLEDLVTCVHIIQLKILTAMRVGQKQKKIDINIPKLDDFIHKTYINVARKVYKNVYLFEINVAPLQQQKHFREIEVIVQEGILNTLRESIPVEAILKAYMDETVEENVTEEIKEEIIKEPLQQMQQQQSAFSQTQQPTPNSTANPIPSSENITMNNSEITGSGIGKLSFNDVDYVRTDNGTIESINAPKSYERLEEISQMRAQARRMEDESDDSDRIKISDQIVELDNLEVHNIDEPIELLPELLLDFEILE